MAIRQWLMAGVNKYANLRAENNSRKHSNRSKPQEQQAGSKAKTSHIFSFTQEIASPNIGRKPKLSKMTMTIDTPLAHVSFPRTGKRGVPQQFPRRLYEMLDSETKLVEVDPNHPVVITWSDSGKAFRIHDVAEFAASVLPKYFRTKKFSSFQRNLNLVSYLLSTIIGTFYIFLLSTSA